ncbi:MAG TPA: hypothetical protein VH185_04930 [Mycobacterium sp.]|jgi:hypothetical protein|nr:hypothetical protein [Mycobacterium sp.]
MFTSRYATAALIGAATAAAAVSIGLAAPAEAQCDQQCQKIKTELKALEAANKTTAIKQLAFWVGNYDQSMKQWFEHHAPPGLNVTGLLTGKRNPISHTNPESGGPGPQPPLPHPPLPPVTGTLPPVAVQR